MADMETIQDIVVVECLGESIRNSCGLLIAVDVVVKSGVHERGPCSAHAHAPVSRVQDRPREGIRH